MLYERRDIKRRHLIYHLEVMDSSGQTLLGHLADLSPEGLLVITDRSLPVGSRYELRIRMPESWQGEPEMALSAECRWSKRDVNPDYFANGMFIHGAPEGYLDDLQKLIREYGFHD